MTSCNVPKKHVLVEFPSKTVKKYPWPALASEIANDDEFKTIKNIIALKKIRVDAVSLDSCLGQKIFLRSLVFLFGMACYLEYPKSYLTIEHHLPNGYFCEWKNEEKLNESVVAKIKQRMLAIIKQDIPIVQDIISHEHALEHFKSIGRTYATLLIKSNNEPHVEVDECDGYMDLHYRTLVSRTGHIIGEFDLKLYDGGMVLVDPYKKMIFNPKLISLYRDYNAWGKMVNVECVGHVNRLIRTDKIRHFIMLSQALHNKKIVQIATRIHEAVLKNKKIVVLIAGPTASGKTTFAKKLSIQLQILGMNPLMLSVDDYYKPVVECPKDEYGNYDFERIEALRVDLLNKHIKELLEGKEIEPPKFDFIEGVPIRSGKKIKLGDRNILMLEGLHCLNEKLTPEIDKSNKFKIFIAPYCQLNLDEHNFIPNTACRLLRRIVRDYNHRGYSPDQTLSRWPTIRRAEEKFIFPHIMEADEIFNSSLDYEINALKVYVLPLLKGVKPTSVHYNQVREFVTFVENFHSIPHDFIPPDSLLREFIGGSIFDIGII